MSSKKKILIQLDADTRPSTFDGVVAVDAGVDVLLSHGDVTPDNVTPLVHGAIFTRKPADLKHTAIFVGGSDVSKAELIFDAVRNTFFGPMRVSVMLDANGCNTTAAAAVLAACRHLDLKGTSALVLGATGPVGLRAAQLLAGQQASVRLGSRTAARARHACERIRDQVDDANVEPVETATASAIRAAAEDVSLIVAAGAAGVEFLTPEQWSGLSSLKVAIDLNAVPPLGLGGIDVTDAATERHGVICYGAIGIGGTKMKLHKAALESLFERNTLELDATELYAIGERLA